MIQKAIRSAYAQLKAHKYTRIFWCIDLHGTCIVSNYENGTYKWLNQQVKDTLKLICSYPESRIIIWSSCYEEEMKGIIELFTEEGIRIDFFNENPEIKNTRTGCFDRKLYFSILLDDKAGFDPDSDWKIIEETLFELHGND